MTKSSNELRNDFLLDVRAAVKRNQVVIMILYSEVEDEYAVFSNSFGLDFDDVLSSFLELPFLGRVRPEAAFKLWEKYFDDVALAEIYAFELDDGLVQMAISECYIANKDNQKQQIN